MRRLQSVLVGLASLLLLGSCGTERTPLQSVPELGDRLAAVDRAVVANDPTAIRQSVAALVRTTERAVQTGRLDATEGARITDAADALLTQLSLMQEHQDAPSEDPDPTDTSSARPEQVSPSPEDDDEEADEDEDEDDTKEKTKGKKDHD